MRVVIFVFVWAVLIGSLAFAQQEEDPTDPTDLGQYQGLIEQSDLPTVELVASLREQAISAVEAGECEAALDVLDQWTTQANWLANLLAQSLEPFYDASRDDREGFSGARIGSLVIYEKMSNDYKLQRNEGMVMKAECLVDLGETRQAAATYGRALDLIDIDNWDLWVRAMNGMFALIGVEQVED